MNRWIWTFVVLAACLDVGFCYECRDSMLEWESNPLARGAFRTCGLAGVVLYRAFWLAFAFALSRTHTRLSWLIAPTWGAAHAYLMVTLLIAGPYVAALRTTDTAHSPMQAETVLGKNTPLAAKRSAALLTQAKLPANPVPSEPAVHTPRGDMVARASAY
jgi:hypothetical protein